MVHELAQQLVDLIFDWGYLGIFIMMSIESSFIPFPSEIVLIPAGYLASKGEMSIFMIMLSGLGGSMVGAFVNYYLAFFLGRRFLLKYGRYFFISKETFFKMEQFFQNHGHISTFTGRLIPGVRQLISIPAGLSKMNIAEFFVFTALGAGIWTFVLTMLGYFIGENQELINYYLKEVTIFAMIAVFLLISWYAYKNNRTRS